MESRIVWLHSLSSVHVGSGDAVDVIDLPVVRETVTNWPYLPGSALKGVFRDACSGLTDAKIFDEAFGKKKDGDGALDSAGSLWFADAKLLCFPVRSLYGTFAWATCPLALSRHARDLRAADLTAFPEFLTSVGDSEIVVCDTNQIADGKTVYLEDLDLTVRQGAKTDALADGLAEALFGDDAQWRETFVGRFAIVSDTVFTFLTETCTEVSAHIKIQEQTKTVQNNGLWYEESVPAEAIFTMPLIAAPRNGSEAASLLGVIEQAAKKTIQIGGKASIGRGLMRVRLTGGAA